MNRNRAVLLALLAAFLLALSSPTSAQQIPLSPTKIPQFAQPLDVLDLNGISGIPVKGGESFDLSICEFQANILPKGTPVVGAVAGVAPATWVWGYQIGDVCAPNFDNNNLPVVQPRSYLGPVVIAERGTPTQITFWNRLPNANEAYVKAYARSTDPTLIWGDPLSLKANATAWPINAVDGAIPYNGSFDPEANECWAAVQAQQPLPANCMQNYGFSPLAKKVDTGLADGTYAAPVPAAVHLHGGEVPSVLDGGPDSWWTKNGIYGHGYYSRGTVTDAAAGKAVYRYPNGQEAAPIWFHDHMLGATRLNVYSGIAGGYVVTEPIALYKAKYAAGLHPLGLSDKNTGALLEATIPLIIQDRMFDTNGQLYFPNLGINPEHPFWVPEFVGDVIVVNGKAWPFLNVQPKRYRFIFLNGSNARSYQLSLMSKTTGMKGPSLWVIGNDQGLLDTPQEVNPNRKPYVELKMMPGERYEVIIDFASVAGQVIEMRNTARTPWMAGAPVNGNTTGRIIRFNVARGSVLDSTFNPAPAGNPPVPPLIRKTPMVRLTTPLGITAATGVTIHKTRRVTLNEVIGAGGPLEILVNNTLYDGSKRSDWYDDFTPRTYAPNTTFYSELPYEGQTELWEIVNLTADAHPMHPHLLAFQVLNRQGLDVLRYTTAYNATYPTNMPLNGAGPPLNYNSSGVGGCKTSAPARNEPLYVGLNPQCVLGGNPDPAAPGVGALIGLPVAPDPQEMGWKDTVQALPNMVTRVLVRFAKADAPVCKASGNTCVDNSNDIGYAFSPNSGHGYVWHCHIVDHEDNEMMRPFSVFDNPGVTHTYLKGQHY